MIIINIIVIIILRSIINITISAIITIKTCNWKCGYGRLYGNARKKPLWGWVYGITRKYDLFTIFV